MVPPFKIQIKTQQDIYCIAWLLSLARCDRKGIMMSRSVAKSASWSDVKVKPWHNTQKQQVTATRSMLVIEMRDRGQNRKPLQRGRNLSIEAIQAVQHLKRAHLHSNPLDHVFNSKFRRLLKFDMIAVLRELLRQNHCLLALKVFILFHSIRFDYWFTTFMSIYLFIYTSLSFWTIISDRFFLSFF